MQIPLKPENERERLHSLQALNILDTPAEDRFDRLTRLTRSVLNVPIAIISLVDEDRQWFKSVDGLDICEIHRDISFCGHAIFNREVFIVPNAIKDPRFSDNPLVKGEPFIRFYAGCPLSLPNGMIIGTLSILDFVSRDLTQAGLNILRDLADLVEEEIVKPSVKLLDELTLLPNIPALKLLYQNMLAYSLRREETFSLFVFRVDLLKELKSQYGMAEANQALLFFSEILKKAFRDTDVLGRIAEDQFVLLAQVDENGANKLITRVQTLVAKHSMHSVWSFEFKYSAAFSAVKPNPAKSFESQLEQTVQLMLVNH